MVSYQGSGSAASPSDYDQYKKAAAAKAAAALGSAFEVPNFDVGNFDMPAASAMPQVDYLKQAQEMFAPQTKYLDQQAAQAKARGAQNDREVAGYYGQTVKDILGMAGGIKNNYASGKKSVGAAYNDALSAVGSTYDKSRDDQLAILKRLGIEQAAPNTLQHNADDRAFIQSVLAANNQGNQNMLTQMGTAAGTFNTEQGNITRQAGAEARTGLKRQLEDILGQIAGKRADVEGQIMQQSFGMQSDAAKLAQQQQQDAYNQYKDQRDFNYKVADDKANLDLKRMSMAGTDQAATDPLGKVYALANQVYGNSQSASSAVRLISEALGNSQPTNAAQFIQAVTDRAHRANPVVNDEANLQRLAALMFNEMYGKQAPSPF